MTAVLDFFLKSISKGCRDDSALKGEALNRTVRSSSSSDRFPALSIYFAECLGPHCTAAAHWEGRQSPVVIRHLQPLQFSDSNSPLCCEATSPITSPQPPLSSGHPSLDFLTPLDGGWPLTGGLWRVSPGRAFLSWGQPREDPVSLFLPVILFSWIRCHIPQSSTEENPCIFQSKKGQP